MEQNTTTSSETVVPAAPQEGQPQQPRPASSGSSMLKKYLNTKIAIIIGVLLILAALIYFFRGTFIAASVNGDAISRKTVINRLEKSAGSQVLDALITESLIKSEARKVGVTVTQDEVNAELARLETQFTAQGSTLEQALASSGMTREGLTQQIETQKLVEKILADKVQVTDADVTKYITDNKVNIPQGEEAAARAQISEQLEVEKLNAEAEPWLTSLKSQAKIKYYVNY